MNSKSESPEAWLQIAQEDIDAARKLASPPSPIWGAAVYHCQQAAEKAIKALLVLHGENPPKRKGHDIGFLLETLEKYADDLNDLDVEAESLTDFATRYRYPSFNVQPLSQEVVEKAIADAEIFVNRAKTHLGKIET